MQNKFTEIDTKLLTILPLSITDDNMSIKGSPNSVTSLDFLS